MLILKQNHVLRMIDVATGAVNLLSGVPPPYVGWKPTNDGGQMDGSLRLADFKFPRDLYVDSPGGSFSNLYIADYANCAIRRIDLTTSQVHTHAGESKGCEIPTQKNSQISGPVSVTFNRLASGQTGLVVLDKEYLDFKGDVRKNDDWTNDPKTNVAGETRIGIGVLSSKIDFAGHGGYADGKLADAAYDAYGIQAHPKLPHLYLADDNNYVIRKVDTSFSPPQVTTFAGSNTLGHADGSTLTAMFRRAKR